MSSKNIHLLVLTILALAPFAALRADYPVHRPPRLTPPPPESTFTIHPDQNKQLIKGLGFEIQSDSIASGNRGLPEEMSGVPHDLVPEERERFCREMLHGFRYCRLAGGLYWRGLDADQKQFVPRWPEQGTELADMIKQAGIEGICFEYWSPAPFWKANGKFVGLSGGENVLRCFGRNFAQDPVYHGDRARFLNDFAAACRTDLQTIRDAGIPISMWGLQNEPFASTGYSSCVYSQANYSQIFSVVAPLIRAFDPKIWIIADDADTSYIAAALTHPETAALVDAFTVHHVGSDSNVVSRPRTPSGFQQPSFQNEYEYLEGPASPDRSMNTVQHIMNWFQLGEAPTWFWIHALKPIGNSEGSGYALGFWRSPGYQGAVKPEFASLQPGHWTWNNYNWNVVVGFLRRMPWDSHAVALEEEHKDNDLRIFAFKRPDGKLVMVVSNRSGTPHTFHLNTGLEGATFQGWRYTPEDSGTDGGGVKLDAQQGADISPLVPDRTWEFWEQN